MASPSNPLATSPMTAAPTPPLPKLAKAPSGASPAPAQPADAGMAAILSGVMPVKNAVDQIMAACRTIAQALPGSEEKVGIMMAAAQEFLPMAAQSALAPIGGMPGGASGMPQIGAPPPGAPPMNL